MKKMSIEDLYPGEAVLSKRAIDKYRSKIANNEYIAPVVTYFDQDIWIVRNGNNRVRAYIEDRIENGKPVGTVTCEEDAGPQRDHIRAELKKLALYRGKGQDAFLNMPVAGEDDYEEQQLQEADKMRESERAKINEDCIFPDLSAK